MKYIIYQTKLQINMRVEIVRHGVPKEEFEQLGKAYPLGKYSKLGQSTNMFKITIDMSYGSNEYQEVDLTWFREWRV